MNNQNNLTFPGPDPFIYKAEGKWWLITSHQAMDERFLPLYQSTDFKNWTFVRGAVGKGKNSESWNRDNFWAPEVLFHNGLYHCFYTAKPDVPKDLPTDKHENEGNRVGLAVSSTPDGPFEDRGIIIPHGSIDGSPWVDPYGTIWLLFTTEHGNNRGLAPGKIGLHKMKPDLSLVDEAPQLIIEQFGWQEGPFFYPMHDGRLALFFSSGAWTDDTYCLRSHSVIIQADLYIFKTPLF